MLSHHALNQSWEDSVQHHDIQLLNRGSFVDQGSADKSCSQGNELAPLVLTEYS